MEVLGSAGGALQGGPDVGCGRARGHAAGGSRRTHTQSQGRRRLAAPRRADHRHRRQRLGQVVARLRHDLRRRPAALRRVAVGLRPPVPGADGEARRRPDRGHLPGHRDSTEEQHPQSAVDRRHHHRDPRLHAPALGARRAHLLPQLRQRGLARDGRGRRAAPGGAARGHAAAGGLRDARRQRARHAAAGRPGRRRDGGGARPARAGAPIRCARRCRAWPSAGSGACWWTAGP